MINELLALFSADERKKLWLLMPLVALMAIFEMAGIAAIAPFLAIVSGDSGDDSSFLVSWILNMSDDRSERSRLLMLGIIAFAALAVSNIFRAYSMWRIYRFAYTQGHVISLRLLKQYLKEPYSFFLDHNSAELEKNIVSETEQVIIGILFPGLNALSRITSVILIVILLLLVDYALAMVVITIFSVIYVLIYYAVRRKLNMLGSMKVEANSARYKAVDEALKGIKDIKLTSREHFFIERYATSSQRYSDSTAMGNIISHLPRFLLEIIAFGGIIAIIITYLLLGRELDQIIPLVGLYALAAYRLFPSLQEIFRAVTTIRFSLSSLRAIRHRSMPVEHSTNSGSFRLTTEVLSGYTTFSNNIGFENVTFYYPGTDRPAIKNVSFSIEANTSVAFVGSTGSGKTTLIDLMLGLLTPTSGRILIDGIELTKHNAAAWRSNIGYVPQEIYLFDDSIQKNIAIGLPDDKISHEAVARSAKIANIDVFINDLPNRYETRVGEQGVRLSGGQRQRLGIARALYSNPKVLVLDEATSALDNVTEKSFQGAVATFSQAGTVIIIAHRLSTIRFCDRIFVLHQGSIVEAGSYLELERKGGIFTSLSDGNTET